MNARWVLDLRGRAGVFALGGALACMLPGAAARAETMASAQTQAKPSSVPAVTQQRPKTPVVPVNPPAQAIPPEPPPSPPALTMMGPLGGTRESCEGLRGLKIEDTTIEVAGMVDGGSFNVPNSSTVYRNLPAFCRVIGMTKPAIRFEIWLPLMRWSGRFEVVGNGGMAGAIGYTSLAGGLRRGNAVASTDTGHVNKPGEGFDASWALNRPELVEDFGYRSLHVTTVNGKQVTRAFYGRPAKRSYYVGCSRGGGQGLMEAQRYPEDFDGIVAGDPAYNTTELYAGAHLYYAQVTLKDPESYIQPAKVKILADAVNKACDKKDGFADGVLSDPFSCKPDLADITCKAGEDTGGCFTPKQVDTVKKIWAGMKDSKGKLVFPGLLPGGEAGANGWSAWVTGSAPFHATHWRAADDFFQFVVAGDANYDSMSFDYDRERDRKMLERLSPVLDANDADLRPYFKRGGKLLLYHGLSDPDISPVNTVNYFKRVEEIVGAPTQGSMRMFLAPGMQHCGGGPGPDAFDSVAAVQRWVEEGHAPERIIASHYTQGALDNSRPLCPYPQKAEYSGKGNAVDATSWVCKVPVVAEKK